MTEVMSLKKFIRLLDTVELAVRIDIHLPSSSSPSPDNIKSNTYTPLCLPFTNTILELASQRRNEIGSRSHDRLSPRHLEKDKATAALRGITE